MSETNPYLGRKIWDDRYLSMTKEIKRWRLAFFAATTVSVVLAGVVAKIATESHVQPYVVETNQGMPYAVLPAQNKINNQRIANFAINQFVINARTVLADQKAEKQLLDKVYDFSANSTLAQLNKYFDQHNPMVNGQTYTVEVHIINSMPLANGTWQVTWDEVKTPLAGGGSTTSRWLGNFSYQFGAVNNQQIDNNPFGFYITAISWSRSIS